MTELAWHFLANRNGVPVLRDGTLLEIGRWYEHAGPLTMCEAGYHASTRAIDALRYAPGPWVSLVEVDGEIVRESDKLVAMRRKALWCYDATAVLLQFARECALSVIHLWDAPEVVRRWLETGDETIREAAATWAAARAAGATWAVGAAAAGAAAAAWATGATWAVGAAAAAARAGAARATWAAAAARASQNALLEGLILAEAPEVMP